MATNPPSTTPDDTDDRSAQAARGHQEGGVVGQSSGRNTPGSGGYELHLGEDDSDDNESGSGSARSATSQNPPAANNDNADRQ